MFDKTEILNESVEQNMVIDAIKKRYEVRVNYKSNDDNEGVGERIIQPVAYGLSRSGNPVVRAFQPFGDSKTKVPHWKLFRLDKFEQWRPLKKRKFEEPPQFPYKTDGKFNPNGDKSMSEVYIIADFVGSKERYEKGGLKAYNDKKKQELANADPNYKLRQNVGKSIKATPDVMKRVAEWNKDKPSFMTDYLRNNNNKEMQQVNNFGNENSIQSSGPIMKKNQYNGAENDGTPISQNSYEKILSLSLIHI